MRKNTKIFVIGSIALLLWGVCYWIGIDALGLGYPKYRPRAIAAYTFAALFGAYNFSVCYWMIKSKTPWFIKFAVFVFFMLANLFPLKYISTAQCDYFYLIYVDHRMEPK